jgi:hypothetical protein
MRKLNNEQIKFLIFLITVIILTPFLMDILSRSWKTDLMGSLKTAINTIDPDSVSILINIVLGFYIGSTILLFIDRYKRIQAILLIIGLVLAVIFFLKNFNTNWNIIYLGIGGIIGVVLGGSISSNSLNRDVHEYRKAANNIGLFSIIYATLSFIILYISSGSQNNYFIKDSFVLLTFAYFFGKVMNYESQGPKIFVLGPANAGKTLFLAGCYLRALNITEIPAKPSKDLLHLVDELHKGEIPWPERTGDIFEYQFTYEIGKIFPRRTTLRTIDYPGVYLERLPEYIYNKKDKKKLTEEEKKYVVASNEIANADRLIFIIDGGKYPNFGDMGIIQYIEIISKLHENGKEIQPYIIVTKSDLLKEEYGKMLDNDTDYKEFKIFIEEKFTSNIYLKQLLNEASNASFYPVFYYTKKIEDEYVPMRDNNGNVYTFGFDKFMDKLAED